MKLFLMLILFMWILMSFTRLLINISNFLRQDLVLFGQSVEYKRETQYGSIYKFSKFVEQNTDKDANILLQTSDMKNFFLLRYFSYPRKVYVSGNNASKSFEKNNKYQYIVIYDTDKLGTDNKILRFKNVSFVLHAKYLTDRNLIPLGKIYKRI